MTVAKFADQIEDRAWKLPFRMNRSRTILLDAEDGIMLCFRTRWELVRFLDTAVLELRRRQVFNNIK